MKSSARSSRQKGIRWRRSDLGIGSQKLGLFPVQAPAMGDWVARSVKRGKNQNVIDSPAGVNVPRPPALAPYGIANYFQAMLYDSMSL